LKATVGAGHRVGHGRSARIVVVVDRASITERGGRRRHRRRVVVTRKLDAAAHVRARLTRGEVVAVALAAVEERLADAGERVVPVARRRHVGAAQTGRLGQVAEGGRCGQRNAARRSYDEREHAALGERHGACLQICVWMRWANFFQCTHFCRLLVKAINFTR